MQPVFEHPVQVLELLSVREVDEHYFLLTKSVKEKRNEFTNFENFMKLMTCLQMCSISSMVRLLGIVFPISVFFSMSGSGLHDGEPWPIEM